MQELLQVMRRLRGPGGCPWDQQQTHRSLKPYLLEEAAEAVDAIEDGDPAAIVEELGDVLLQIAFHVVIAEETDAFSYADVERRIVSKLKVRHPHVFGNTKVAGADDVVANWKRIKANEQDKAQPMTAEDSVPRSLPALMRAGELGSKLGWETASKEDIAQALANAPASSEEHIGRLLLGVVDHARALGVNPEVALRGALAARLKEAGTER